jgi:signal transduction histidine kinase
MSLKKRLIISNAAIVIVPLLITIVASFAFILVYSRVFDTDISFENIKKLASIEYELFNADRNILQKDPDLILDKEYQQYLYAKFLSINADIVILKRNDIVFSTRKFNQIDVEKSIEAGNSEFYKRSVLLNRISYIVKTFSIIYKDGHKGTVILLAPVSKENIASEKLILFAVIIFVISFLITNGVAAIAFSGSILRPLKRLQEAAGEISRGSLSYEVIEEGDLELKDLCRSFEQMRLKLKESVYTQMKYDDNRKMLVSSISHDLKTPITSIKGYVEGIIDGVANTPDKIEKYLKTIYSKAVHVDSMIDDLLLYSKLDLNQIPFDFEKTDIVSYFQDCANEIEPELEKHNIKLSLQNELKDFTYIMMDRERIRRVIMNILDNARKYMDKPQGEISITLREAESNIVIELKDNGSGISKEDLPFIFDRFYRADAARSKRSGSGLGLAIAKQIVEGHGGKIWVRSFENKGTSIMISFKKIPQ